MKEDYVEINQIKQVKRGIEKMTGRKIEGSRLPWAGSWPLRP